MNDVYEHSGGGGKGFDTSPFLVLFWADIETRTVDTSFTYLALLRS